MPHSLILGNYILKNFFFNLLIFERQSVSEGGAGREGSRAGSRLQAVSTEPDAGLELMDRKIIT